MLAKQFGSIEGFFSVGKTPKSYEVRLELMETDVYPEENHWQTVKAQLLDQGQQVVRGN
ncbi:hypothetical protein P4S63_26245 [Pseudoalteromonas sp. B193]